MRANTVTKRDLVDRIGNQLPYIKKNHISDVVQMFMNSIGDALVENQRVELRDFGVFTPRERKARMARNPKTGEAVSVAATKVCGFRAGKELKQRLAASYSPSDAPVLVD